MADRRLTSAGLKNFRGPEFRRLLKDLKAGAFDLSPTLNSVTIDNITIDGNAITAAGQLELDGLQWPTSDGTAGHVLTTDGAGNLSFTAAGSFDLSAQTLDTVIGASDLMLIHDGSNKKITRTNVEASLNHNNLSNYVANEHIDWTSTSSNFSTSGTAATGNLTVTGTISVTSTVDGRDIATDGSKLDTIETSADVTDETNVVAALDGATLTTVAAQSTDKILIQDVSDADNIKVVTVADVASGGSDTFATIQVDGVGVSTNAPTLDFDGTDFTLTESPTDDFDITINAERIQDIAGAMVTGNTETGISVTYQDIDGTLDFVVSDLTVAGDSGSTGMTPGDTLTVSGGEGIDTSMSGDTLTIAAEDASTSNKGVASFDSGDFSVSSGAVSLTNSPSFYAYRGSNQSITNNTLTKVQFDTEVFDTDSDFDATTNYRFTPSKAGKYLIGVCIKINALFVDDYFAIHIYKNGSSYSRQEYEAGTTRAISEHISTIVDMNGTTDYVEGYVIHIAGSTQTVNGGANTTYFYGARIDGN